MSADVQITLDWSDEARALIHPFRGDDLPLQPLTTTAADLFGEAGAHAAGWSAGDVHATRRGRDLAARVQSHFQGAPVFDPGVEAAAATFGMYLFIEARRRDFTKRIFDVWVRRNGLEDAARALTVCADVRLRVLRGQRDAYWLERVDEGRAANGLDIQLDTIYPWLSLRRHLALADVETFERVATMLRGFARAHQEQGEQGRAVWRIGPALALPADEPLWRAAFAAGAPGAERGKLAALLSCVSSLADAERVIGSLSYLNRKRAIAFLPTLAWKFDSDAWPVVESFCGDAYTEKHHLPTWLTTAAIFVGEAPARALSKSLARRERRVAAHYFGRHPELARSVLPAIAAEPKADKVLREAIRAVLEGVEHASRAEHEDRDSEPSVEAMPAPLRAPIQRAPALPSWVNIASLPRVVLDGDASLPPSGTKRLVELLIASDRRAVHEELTQVRDACRQTSLDELARALCSAWIADGAPRNGAWAARSIGALGSEASAGWMAARIEGFAADRGYGRVRLGLEVLARIGTPLSLSYVAGWAGHGRPRRLKEVAAEVLAEVAESRGLSTDQLDDRVAPTLGLELDGSRRLSYGPREFTVGFDEMLTPFIVDADGRRLRSVPRLRKTDDRNAAARAKAVWAQLKKDASRVARAQVDRLERAMVTRRSWSVADFAEHVVAHPLVGHLARRLVFGSYRDDVFVATFRVAEDRTLADRDDARYVLSDDQRVRIVHPLQLGAEELAGWAASFVDYEIVQPFAQLGRRTFRPTAEEKTAQSLSRYDGVEANGGRLLALRNSGWTMVGEAVWLEGARRELGDGRQIELTWDGGVDIQRPGARKHVLGPLRLEDESATWGDVDPVLFSELLADIAALHC